MHAIPDRVTIWVAFVLVMILGVFIAWGVWAFARDCIRSLEEPANENKPSEKIVQFRQRKQSHRVWGKSSLER
jgi:hypothetical protein